MKVYRDSPLKIIIDPFPGYRTRFSQVSLQFSFKVAAGAFSTRAAFRFLRAFGFFGKIGGERECSETRTAGVAFLLPSLLNGCTYKNYSISKVDGMALDFVDFVDLSLLP